MSSSKRLARIAGLLYLIVGIFGGLAVGYATPKVYVAGDTASTATHVLANSGLVRFSVLADLLQATVFVFLALALYALLSDVNRNAARAMDVFESAGGCADRGGHLLPGGHARGVPGS